MATTNSSLAFLKTEVQQWFDDATTAGTYSIPILASNIITYNTAPLENSTSPNWVIMHGVNTLATKESAGADVVNSRIVIILFSRFEQTEVSKEAAERWLNDAEEVLTMNLAEIVSNPYWHSVESSPPRRDIIRPYLGKYRTSTTLVTFDLR